MPQAIIRITSNYSKFAKLIYGPYESGDAAATHLRTLGWTENINGERGLWFVQSGRYDGINARIEDIQNIRELPACILQKQGTSAAETAQRDLEDFEPA